MLPIGYLFAPSGWSSLYLLDVTMPPELIEACDETIPFEVCEAVAPLVMQLRNLDEAIARLDSIIAKLA